MPHQEGGIPHQEGDRVESTSDAQGLKRGQQYTVHRVVWEPSSSPWWNVYTHHVRDDAGKVFPVDDGHLLLQKVRENRYKNEQGPGPLKDPTVKPPPPKKFMGGRGEEERMPASRGYDPRGSRVRGNLVRPYPGQNDPMGPFHKPLTKKERGEFAKGIVDDLVPQPSPKKKFMGGNPGSAPMGGPVVSKPAPIKVGIYHRDRLGNLSPAKFRGDDSPIPQKGRGDASPLSGPFPVGYRRNKQVIVTEGDGTDTVASHVDAAPAYLKPLHSPGGSKSTTFAAGVGDGYDRKGMPIQGHPYHHKTDAELNYIIRDAHAAAEANHPRHGGDYKTHAKYLDQVNDANTVLGYRRRERIFNPKPHPTSGGGPAQAGPKPEGTVPYGKAPEAPPDPTNPTDSRNIKRVKGPTKNEQPKSFPPPNREKFASVGPHHISRVDQQRLQVALAHHTGNRATPEDHSTIARHYRAMQNHYSKQKSHDLASSYGYHAGIHEAHQNGPKLSANTAPSGTTGPMGPKENRAAGQGFVTAGEQPSAPNKHGALFDKSGTQTPRTRYNWGYHDGAHSARRKEPYLHTHHDKHYKAGHNAGYEDQRAGKYEDGKATSDAAWVEHTTKQSLFSPALARFAEGGEGKPSPEGLLKNLAKTWGYKPRLFPQGTGPGAGADFVHPEGHSISVHGRTKEGTLAVEHRNASGAVSKHFLHPDYDHQLESIMRWELGAENDDNTYRKGPKFMGSPVSAGGAMSPGIRPPSGKPTPPKPLSKDTAGKILPRTPGPGTSRVGW